MEAALRAHHLGSSLLAKTLRFFVCVDLFVGSSGAFMEISDTTVVYNATPLPAEAGVAETVNHGRPNIIWVMFDDLGWGEVGLFSTVSGDRKIDTPNLDDFGRDGMVFHHAYSGYTVCAPSRTAFFTGRHSGHFHFHGLNGRDIRVNHSASSHLLPQVLKRAGYSTGLFGKAAPLENPVEQGFDTFIGQISQNDCHNMYPLSIDKQRGKRNHPLVGNTGIKNRDICMKYADRFNYTTDVFFREAMLWMDGVRKKANPFFLYLSFTVPHAGGYDDFPESSMTGAPVPSDMQYATKPWPNVEKDHAATITFVDSLVGKMMQKLKDFGVDQNTLVIIASDNGAHNEGGHDPTFFQSSGGLRGRKRSLYEGGVRSPTMARWPGVIKPGTNSDYAWAFWDAYATLAEVAGVIRGVYPNDIDGVSIVKILRGEEQPPKKILFFTWGPGYAVIMDGRWKGLVPLHSNTTDQKPSESDAMQVYDLWNDKGEGKDLAETNKTILAQLRHLVTTRVHAEHLWVECYQCVGFSRDSGAAASPQGSSSTVAAPSTKSAAAAPLASATASPEAAVARAAAEKAAASAAIARLRGAGGVGPAEDNVPASWDGGGGNMMSLNRQKDTGQGAPAELDATTVEEGGAIGAAANNDDFQLWTDDPATAVAEREPPGAVEGPRPTTPPRRGA